jgi:glycosyltransferase involved in cell wall biosynthesis
MRVLIDATNINDGGGVNHLTELLNATSPDRDFLSQITILARPQTLKRLPHCPLITKTSHPVFNSNFLKRVYWLRRNLSREIIKSRSDILFSPGGLVFPSGAPSVTMSRNLLPFDTSALTSFGLSAMTLKMALLRRAQTLSFRKADGLIFLTKYAETTVLNVTGDLRARVEVIPHGVSSRFYAEPRLEAPNSFRIAYVSRIEPYKHHAEVLAAAAQLNVEGYELELELYGQARNDQARKLSRTIGALNSKKAFIKFHRDVNSREIPSILASSHIGLFASSCENMPNTLLEYMASGLPIACSSRGPMPEILGDAGVYFEPQSPLSIKNALKTLVDKREYRIQLAEAAQARAKEFTWDSCAQKTWNFIRSFA